MAEQNSERNLKPFFIVMAVTIIPPTIAGAMFLFKLFGIGGAIFGGLIGGAIGFGGFMFLGGILSCILPDRIFVKYTGAASTSGGDPHHQFERAFTQNELLK